MTKLPWFINKPTPDVYLTDRYIVLDLETTNLGKGDAEVKDNYIVYGYYTSPVLGSGHIDSEADLNTILTKAIEQELFLVAHGSKFELKWALRAGVQIERLLVYDTLLADYVRAGNRKWSLDLDSVSHRYGGQGKSTFISKCIHVGICPSLLPRSLLRRYCKIDVLETEYVFRKQRAILKDEGLLNVLFLRCISTPVISDIEMNGLLLDESTVLQVHRELMLEWRETLTKLDEITGGINMSSPQQVAVFLYNDLGFKEVTDWNGNPKRGKPNKKFPNGQPLTDEPTILLLKSKNKKQRDFLEFKIQESKLRKKITGYTERFMYACGHLDSCLNDKKTPDERFSTIVKGSCYIHGNLNQSIAQTHRLTSNDPNLQNLERKLKIAFRSRFPNGKMRSADFEQLEFRTAGVLSQDPQILEDILNKADIHSYTASIVFDKEWKAAGSTRQTEEGTELRYKAKARTFKPLYGGTSGTKKEKDYYAAFKEKYKATSKMQQDWVGEVLKNKKLRTVTGLVFYWPDTKLKSSGYITNTSKIYDYPIQMFATADIAPTAVCLLWHHIKSRGLKSLLINEVHDSALIDNHPDELEIIGKLVEQAMTEDVINFLDQVIDFKINYPLEIEQTVGDCWV